MKDGWHVICGRCVKVEEGWIRRAVKKDRNGAEVPAWIYRWSNRYNCWIREDYISPSAFRAGIRRGTIEVK